MEKGQREERGRKDGMEWIKSWKFGKGAALMDILALLDLKGKWAGKDFVGGEGGV